MLKEICDDEKLPIGYQIQAGHHLSCDNGHSYAMTKKVMAVGNNEANDGPSDAFLAIPIQVFEDDGITHKAWISGDPVKPLDAPYNCPTCGLQLGIR